MKQALVKIDGVYYTRATRKIVPVEVVRARVDDPSRFVVRRADTGRNLRTPRSAASLHERRPALLLAGLSGVTPRLRQALSLARALRAARKGGQS